METEEEDDTNDEDFNLEIRQFSSCSHRFSKVSKIFCNLSMYCSIFADFGNITYRRDLWDLVFLFNYEVD